MRRREFVAGLGGVAAWPMAARAQQQALPVIGILNGVSFASSTRRMTAIREGLRETGYVEGQNIAIEYRSADAEYDRLPALAADLAQRHVAAIIAIGAVNSVLAAKAATTTIPIIFAFGSDPVRLGVVASLSRPGGNVTGLTSQNAELLGKRLEVLRELVPKAAMIGLLVNPSNPNSEPSERELRRLADTGGWALHVAKASKASEIESAYARFVHAGVGAVLHATDALFATQRNQLVALAARYQIPSIYPAREAVEAGGLLSYGTVDADLYREAGIYTGRILRGTRPSDLPVAQSTRIELFLNLTTAKMLGLSVPQSILVRADEVIE